VNFKTLLSDSRTVQLAASQVMDAQLVDWTVCGLVPHMNI